MPLSPYQAELAKILAVNRSADSYLAGGAALHLAPGSLRFSNDLDFFNDSAERTAKAFSDDSALLIRSGHKLQIQLRIKNDNFVRAVISKAGQSSKIEWAQDSAWRFIKTQKNAACGFLLHPLDLASNKLLALAGRDEARDLIDTLYIHQNVLPLGALCWAAVGKDPGFTPHSLLELIRRRGKLQSEDLRRLHLLTPVDHHLIKMQWLEAIEQAEQFIRKRPVHELGCLYYSRSKKIFVQPADDDDEDDLLIHFGQTGGRPLPVK